MGRPDDIVIGESREWHGHGSCLLPDGRVHREMLRPTVDRMTEHIADEREGVHAPLVSVIIPCVDDTHVAATLKSVATQRAAPPFEVVVVNGHDSDLGRRLEVWGQRMQLQVLGASGGPTGGGQRNKGAAASRGSLLLFVDADDVVGEGYVRAMADALESHDLVCSRVDLSLLNPGIGARTHSQERGLLTGGMSFLPFAGAGTLGIRRSLFEEVGGFDALLRCYEEADLCWRIQLAGGGPPAFVADARLHYRLKGGRIQQWRKAVAFGQTQAFLYARYRRVGMPRQSMRDAIAEWGCLPSRLYRGVSGHFAPSVLREAGVRIGRLRGSVLYRVLYP